MDWNTSLGLILAAAFGIGALHALEPGHGKSIMGAYLIATHGGIRHAVVLGIVVTITHTIVIFALAIAALKFASTVSSAHLMFWLEIVSGAIVVAVGVWMTLQAFGLLRRRGSHSHGHSHDHGHTHDHGPGHSHDHGHAHEHAHAHAAGHAHEHPHHSHEHPHAHPHHSHAEAHSHAHEEHHHEHDDHHHHGHSHELRIPAGRDPLGFGALVAVGASGGLVPCPAALTALLAAVNLGRPAAGIAVVSAMSLGIALTLVAVGIAFVQAEKAASRLFGSRGVMRHAPRFSAIVITLLGIGLLARAILSHDH